ncbi:MAG: alpha/beta fold hydrolase [Terriglobia bacterium]
MPRPSDPNVSAFAIDSDPPVRGFLHRPAVSADNAKAGEALVLTHGAGSNCQAPLLVAVAGAFAATGVTVLRCDLPYRQKRPHGPPFSGSGAEDREGLKSAVAAIRRLAPDRPFHRVFLGGHSYGGRQATMVAANDAALVDGLLLLSYPLHPPRKPDQLRTAHFSSLRTPALFVHGSRDPFGSVEEMESALKLIPAPTALIPVEGAGHDLSFGREERNAALDLPSKILDAFERFLGTSLRNR